MTASPNLLLRFVGLISWKSLLKRSTHSIHLPSKACRIC